MKGPANLHFGQQAGPLNRSRAWPVKSLAVLGAWGYPVEQDLAQRPDTVGETSGHTCTCAQVQVWPEYVQPDPRVAWGVSRGRRKAARGGTLVEHGVAGSNDQAAGIKEEPRDFRSYWRHVATAHRPGPA